MKFIVLLLCIIATNCCLVEVNTTKSGTGCNTDLKWSNTATITCNPEREAFMTKVS